MFQYLRGIVLIATIMFLFSWEGAKANTLETMVHYCEKLESQWRQNPPTSQGVPIPNDGPAATCYGYLLGFTDASRLVDSPSDCSKGWGPNCRPLLNMCTPTGVLFDQILAVILTYTRNHPAQWHEDAAPHFQFALVAAFPCKGSAQ